MRRSVIFHPGWMTARHKQSFYVSRTALILNALMGNIEIPGGCVLGKSPEYYGRKGLKHLTDRVPKVDGAARGRRRHHPAAWDPAIGMLHQAFAAMETGQPYGIGAYFAYRHDPLHRPARSRGDATRAGQAEAARLHRRALLGDGLVRRRHPPRVDLPRARQHPGQMNGPVPVFVMRDQAIAPRFDSRPAWWIFREILRRMDIKEALDFETIEEIWNYQLDGTGVTVAEMREKGSSAWPTRRS